jgi:hypothetical protein
MSPFNRWGFQHVREIVPSADIANDPDDLWRLPQVNADLTALMLNDGQGGHIGLDAFLTRTQTDAFVLVHRGRVLCEQYANGMAPTTPHILMSVSKSMLGLLAGILAANGVLDIDAPVERLCPNCGAARSRAPRCASCWICALAWRSMRIISPPPARSSNTARQPTGTHWNLARRPPICVPSCKPSPRQGAAWRRLQLCFALH